MSKLVWDEAGKHYFEAGVSHGVFYKKGNGTTTAPTHSEGDTSLLDNEGVVWNGLTAVTESPSGADANDLWADDAKYATLRAAETFGATIEAYTCPDEFLECDGFAAPVSGLYLGQQSRKTFGFCYRTAEGSDTEFDTENGAYKLHIIYNATASPAERSYATVNDSPDAITLSWEISSTPVNAGEGYKSVSSITIDSRKFATGQAKTNLENLEKILYGSDPASTSGSGTAAWLPTPAKVIEVLSAVA